MIHKFTEDDFQRLCKETAGKDKDLAYILETYGYPPFWTRPNTFKSLIHIILEQQVSLQSALSALNKLEAEIGKITPDRVLALSDECLRACYFSRQKASYARGLARAILDKKISLKRLEKLSDNDVRETLYEVKGIGAWTADVYLIFVLHRVDIFPSGDLAALNAAKQLKNQHKDTGKDIIVELANQWAPHRTIATMLLWHFYLSTRGKTKKNTIKEIP